MPKKDEKRSTVKEKQASASSVPESVKEAKSPDADKKAAEPPKVERAAPPRATPTPPAKMRLVSFARWFAARSREKGWKPHWVAGMKAYANTSGRLPMEGWDELFRNY